MLYGVEEMLGPEVSVVYLGSIAGDLPDETSRRNFKSLGNMFGAYASDVRLVAPTQKTDTQGHLYLPMSLCELELEGRKDLLVAVRYLPTLPYPPIPEDDNLSITWRAHMTSQGFASVPTSNIHDEVLLSEPHRVYQMTVSMSPMRVSGEQRRVIAELVRRQAAELAATLQMMVTDKQARVQCTVESSAMGLKRIDLTL